MIALVRTQERDMALAFLLSRDLIWVSYVESLQAEDDKKCKHQDKKVMVDE